MMQDLSMHIVDIVQNSIRADASLIHVTVFNSKKSDLCGFRVIDNGIGMNPEMLDKVLDPFFTTRTSRRFGLGLPLLKMTCQMCEGNFECTSTPWVETKIEAQLKCSHIDTPPWGDLAQTWMECFNAFPDGHLVFAFDYDEGQVLMDSKEIVEIIGDKELCHQPHVLVELKEYLQQQLHMYCKEENDEIVK